MIAMAQCKSDYVVTKHYCYFFIVILTEILGSTRHYIHANTREREKHLAFLGTTVTSHIKIITTDRIKKFKFIIKFNKIFI